jgi:hypothetical protein
MKPYLRRNALILSLGLLLALPLAGRAAVIYSDDFSTDADRGTPAGFTVTPSTVNNDYSFVVTPEDYQFGITADGANFLYFAINGPDPGLVPPPYPAEYESVVDANANVGFTYQLDTTYTLTYEIAGGNTLNTSLDANGTVIGSTTKSAAAGSSSFVSGPTVTIDTLDNPLLVGKNIGFETDLTDTLDYTETGATTDYVLTATPDVVLPLTPEPSTLALMFASFLVLVGLRMRRPAARE